MVLFGKSGAKKQAIKDGFENVKKVKRKWFGGDLVFPKGADKVEIEEQGWCLCSLASKGGFLDCEYLREINRHLADKTTLRKGDFVAVPKRRKKATSDKDKTVVKAVRPKCPPPMVWFIKEKDGLWHTNPPIELDDEGKPKLPVEQRHFPKLDGEKQLAITNYHVDKTNEGTQDFADATEYGYDADSKEDPDHFKVQVYDNSVPEGTDEVKVKLLAMRPSYRKKDEVFVEQTTNYREPPDGQKRTTEVTCKRIPDTNYFRSPYLRLVTTETDHDARPKQTLLVTDYWDNGDGDTGAGKDKAGVIEKYFSEILHQKVRASYDVAYCKPKKCKILKDAKLDCAKEVHLAMHILNGSAATLAQAREQIYKWMRRCLAQTNVRPHLKILRRVEVPKNMITIADGNGKYAKGKEAGGVNKSYLSVTIAGKDYKYPGKDWLLNKSPAKSAAGLKAVLEKAGFKVDGPHNAMFKNFAPALDKGMPKDMLIFESDGKTPANVTGVSSTDTAQKIIHTNDIHLNIVIDTPYQKRKTRAVWRSYNTDYFDIYVGGADIMSARERPTQDTPCWGIAQWGDYDDSKHDMGPSCVLCADAMNPTKKVFNASHEMLHALMHVGHSWRGPPPAAGQPGHKPGPVIGNYEIMNSPTTNGADTKDGTKHIADKPNKVKYNVAHGAGPRDSWSNSGAPVILDGSEVELTSTKKITQTPTTRFRAVGSFYGLLVNPSQRRLNDQEDRG